MPIADKVNHAAPINAVMIKAIKNAVSNATQKIKTALRRRKTAKRIAELENGESVGYRAPRSL